MIFGGTVQYSTVRMYFFFRPLQKKVNVTHLARCVTFQRFFPRQSLYVIILTRPPHLLQLSVTIYLVFLGLKCGQIWQFSQYIYIYSPLINELTLQCDKRKMTKNLNWWNYSQHVFEGPDYCMNICVGGLVTLRTYLDAGTAVCCIPDLYILS